MHGQGIFTNGGSVESSHENSWSRVTGLCTWRQDFSLGSQKQHEDCPVMLEVLGIFCLLCLISFRLLSSVFRSYLYFLIRCSTALNLCDYNKPMCNTAEINKANFLLFGFPLCSGLNFVPLSTPTTPPNSWAEILTPQYLRVWLYLEIGTLQR